MRQAEVRVRDVKLDQTGAVVQSVAEPNQARISSTSTVHLPHPPNHHLCLECTVAVGESKGRASRSRSRAMKAMKGPGPTPWGLRGPGVGPPLCSSRACLHAVFTAFLLQCKPTRCLFGTVGRGLIGA